MILRVNITIKKYCFYQADYTFGIAVNLKKPLKMLCTKLIEHTIALVFCQLQRFYVKIQVKQLLIFDDLYTEGHLVISTDIDSKVTFLLESSIIFLFEKRRKNIL